MKIKRVLVAIVLGLIIVTMLGPKPVKAQAIITEYTATEFPTGLIYPGDWKPLPNGGQHFRGQVVSTFEAATDPRASGTGTLVANGNLNASLTGPIWGTIVIQVPDSEACHGGGVWQGTWAGKMSLSQFYVYWSGDMQGVSGCVEGMTVRFESDMCFPQSPCAYTGTLVNPYGE